jgi:cytoskeleton protein RodZ
MADIGETLRESRMRRRIDMAEVESATKIRAKYLRALENEEWDLLPGPTFVKSFLRTYAEYLELDARMLVEEYKQRYERTAGGELAPFGGLGGPRRQHQRRPRRRSRSALGPVAVVGLGAIVLLVAFYVLGKSGENDADNPPDRSAGAVATATPTPARKKKEGKRQAAPTRVSLRLVATGTVYVCLVDGNGKRLMNGETLHAGDRSDRFTAKRMRVNFGNASVRMRVGGKTYPVAESSDPVGYELRPGHSPRRLPNDQRPNCA